MSKRIIGILTAAAAIGLAVWLGANDGREHRTANSAEGAAN